MHRAHPRGSEYIRTRNSSHLNCNQSSTWTKHMILYCTNMIDLIIICQFMCHKKNIFHSESYMFLNLSIISNTGLRKFPPPENSAPENSFLGNFPLIYFPPRKIPPMENSPLGKILPKENSPPRGIFHPLSITFWTSASWQRT